MQRKFLLTVVGEDRPGIVARLTELLVKHDANLEESRMAILGGEFAAIVLVTAPAERMNALTSDLSVLQKEGISVSVKETLPLDPGRFEGHSCYQLTLSGADHEGIVYKVSQLLRDRSINIQSMETLVVPAPETATPLFQMKATIAVPPSIPVDQLHKDLEHVGRQECVDIQLELLDSANKSATALKV